jgi:TolB-like protein
MKIKSLFYPFIPLFLLLPFMTACEVKMAPSDGWASWFNTQSDSSYYKGKAEKLVKKLSNNTFEYEISRVAVIDPVNAEQKSPILGEYISTRVVEAIAKKRVFRVTQQGEVEDVLTRLNLPPSFSYTRAELERLGKALNAQAILTGRLTDLGTNLDVHLTLIDIASGEVISSATESLTRTKFAVELLRHY